MKRTFVAKLVLVCSTVTYAGDIPLPTRDNVISVEITNPALTPFKTPTVSVGTTHSLVLKDADKALAWEKMDVVLWTADKTTSAVIARQVPMTRFSTKQSFNWTVPKQFAGHDCDLWVTESHHSDNGARTMAGDLSDSRMFKVK